MYVSLALRQSYLKEISDISINFFCQSRSNDLRPSSATYLKIGEEHRTGQSAGKTRPMRKIEIVVDIASKRNHAWHQARKPQS